jgi:hypothetical protein
MAGAAAAMVEGPATTAGEGRAEGLDRRVGTAGGITEESFAEAFATFATFVKAFAALSAEPNFSNAATAASGTVTPDPRYCSICPKLKPVSYGP